MKRNHLLFERRFAPFFATQFLGAFNDNVFKNAVMILLAYQGADAALAQGLDPNLLIQLCAALFILPFLLFSALAGQLADKLEKTRVIRAVKLLEIAIMVIGGYGLVRQNFILMFAAVFLLGLHSTLFGPIKYAILPQTLREDELLRGNGLVEMGTFVAILLGEVLGGALIGLQPSGPLLVAGAATAFAVLGYLVARAIPPAAANAPDLELAFAPLRETRRILALARTNPRVWLSLLGASWFWFYGAVLISQFPGLTRQLLGGNEQVVTVLLAVFSLGVGLGSVLCERFSHGRVDTSLAPYGALGLALFGFDFAYALPAAAPHAALLDAASWLASPGAGRILGDLFLLGFSGGVFIVPLYAVMQKDSDPHATARVIAANNVMNAVFMIASALWCALLLKTLGLRELLGLTVALHLGFCLYLLSRLSAERKAHVLSCLHQPINK